MRRPQTARVQSTPRGPRPGLTRSRRLTVWLAAPRQVRPLRFGAMTEDLEATPAGAAIGPSSGLGEGAGAAAAPREARGGIALGLVRAARPKQWIKNVLVLAAPGAAGVLVDAAALDRRGAAFVALCLVASGTYLLNDVADVEADRAHPLKRHRPIAVGRGARRGWPSAPGSWRCSRVSPRRRRRPPGAGRGRGTYVVLTLAYTAVAQARGGARHRDRRVALRAARGGRRRGRGRAPSRAGS